VDMNQLPPLDPSQFGPNVPRRHDPKIAKLANKYLEMSGWQIVGEVPNVKKLVMLAVPHTSNFDGWNAVMVILSVGIDFKLMGKKELFCIPVIGQFLKWGGIISIDRQKKGSTLQATIERFKTEDQFWLGLAPEGTRSYTEKWKTGFYHIAVGADVPILPIAMDYKTKQIRFLPLFYPTGNIDADLPKIYAYYKGVEGLHQEKMSKPLQDLNK
jgi:1-acyl-sn-glycerol-3-phosphate acyltransferase